MYNRKKSKIMENTTFFIHLEISTDSDHHYNSTLSSPIYVTWKSIFIIGILLFVCLLGIIGNGLVIWFGIFRMKKTVNVVWFLSLAVADFSCAFFFPFSMTQDMLGHWSFGELMCKLIHFLVSINMNVSVLQLMVISIDRFICVVFPIWCHNHRRPRLAFIVAIIIWMVSLSLALPTVISIDVNDSKVCIMEDSGYITRTILDFVFVFLLPLIIIVFCYIMIVLYIRRKRIVASSKPFKSIMAIIIVFIICSVPYNVFTLFIAFESIDSCVAHYGYLITLVLIVLNSCINPIIYVFIGRDFKEKFCGSLQAIFEKAFIENEDKTDFEKQETSIAITRLNQDYEEVIAYD